jgi:nucleotide-binding universal stress UspA family protein
VKRIVVGLIDTPASRAALRWAVRQATATGSLIEVVTCIQPLQTYVWSEVLGTSAPPLVTVGGLRTEATALQERVLRQEFGPRFGAVPVRARIVAGDVATELSRAAADADLLAVGRSHHRRWFFRRSIGDRCSYHFDGPVVLVPTEHDAGEARDEGSASVTFAFDARSADASLAERR